MKRTKRFWFWLVGTAVAEKVTVAVMTKVLMVLLGLLGAWLATWFGIQLP